MLDETQQNQKILWWKKWLAVYVSVILFLLVFWGGFAVGQKNPGYVQISKEGITIEKNGADNYGKVKGKSNGVPEFLTKDVNFNLYWEAWDIIQKKYVDRPTGETKLLYGSLAGMVASLQDPFSVFLEPQITENFTEELSGEIEGIGAEIGIKDNQLTIISPLPESPAETAGIKAGDKIWEINGESSIGISLDVAVGKIRGPKGTNVVLTVSHNGSGEKNKISITRDTIKIVSASWKILDRKPYDISDEKKIGYVQITNFNADTGSRMRTIVQEVILEQPDGLILDLRNDPGGFLTEAINIASHWVAPGGVVVEEKAANGNIKSHLADGRAELAGIPTVVLINKGSASASEIVAGALQDNDLAKIVGKTSFGKGSVQSIEYLSDGSSIKITVARWLTPNGNQIDKEGIKPDIEIDLDEEKLADGLDTQILKAVDILLKRS